MLNVSAAHAARRGQKDSLEVQAKRAETWFIKQSHIGHREQEYAKYLRAETMLPFLQQFPLGKYNLDFLVYPGVVVEMLCGGGCKSAVKGRVERCRAILGRYNLIEIKLLEYNRTFNNKAVTERLVDYLYEFEEIRRVSGEHRMIRSDGRVIIPGKQRNGHVIEFVGKYSAPTQS